MMPIRRHLLQAAAGAALQGLLLPAARAQVFPTRPLRLVVPFAAGGPADTLARAIAPRLADLLGQSVLVENRPGAGGILGAESVARAAPDGYSLLLANSSTHSIAPALNPRLPYSAELDFTPIAPLAMAPGVVLVPLNSPARTIRELVELARRRPGQLSYGSSGNGTIVHLSTEYFKAETGIYIVHIPYRGTALAMADLIAGHIDLLFDSVVTGLAQAREGRVRALAVTSLKASPLAPDLPPVAEMLPGFEASTWFGLYGPRGLGADIVARLQHAVEQALAEPAMLARLAQIGAEPLSGDAKRLSAHVRADAARWKALVGTRGIRLD